MVSGSGDRTGKIWDVKIFLFIKTIKIILMLSMPVKFSNPNKYFAIIAGYDGRITLLIWPSSITNTNRELYRLMCFGLFRNSIGCMWEPGGGFPFWFI